MRIQITISKPMALTPSNRALAKAIRFAIIPFLFVAFVASSSQAQQRTFVSGLGSDSDPCTRTAPCRTFAQAVSQTASGGEVVALDSAGYGAFSISKPVTVTAPPGVYAGITVTSNSGNGIDINANFGAGDKVTLRGLTIVGPGASVSSGNGISFNSGRRLHVEGCEVQGFGTGILVSDSTECFIKDTVVKDGVNGVWFNLASSSGTISATMDHLSVNNNDWGVLVVANGLQTLGALIQASIRDSTLSGNLYGIAATGENGGQAYIEVENCLVTNGAQGLVATGITSGQGRMSISNCLISHNHQYGFVMSGPQASIYSRGNNTIFGNALTNVGSLTPLSGQ